MGAIACVCSADWRASLDVIVTNCPFIFPPTSAERIRLEATLGTQDFTGISDAEIIASNPRVPADVQERKAAYKAESLRLGLADDDLCIDAGSKFLRDFYERDFIAADGEPYTVIHEHKELWQMAVNHGQRRLMADVQKEVGAMQQIFQRQGETEAKLARNYAGII